MFQKLKTVRSIIKYRHIATVAEQTFTALFGVSIRTGGKIPLYRDSDLRKPIYEWKNYDSVSNRAHGNSTHMHCKHRCPCGEDMYSSCRFTWYK